MRHWFLLAIVVLVLGSLTSIIYYIYTVQDEHAKKVVVQDVKRLHYSVFTWCDPDLNPPGCMDGEELSINDFIQHYQIPTDDVIWFHEDNYDLDYDTIVATYTDEGIWLHLEADDDHKYEFHGLITDIDDFDKDDVQRDD